MSAILLRRWLFLPAKFGPLFLFAQCIRDTQVCVRGGKILIGCFLER